MRSALSRHIYTDWNFYRGLLAITLPIALQNIILSLIHISVPGPAACPTGWGSSRDIF